MLARTDTSFVGREQELARLAAIVHRAPIDGGQIVCLHGGAGIGKSRLVTELSRLVGLQGLQVLRASCDRDEQNCAYAPIIELLNGFPESDSGGGLRTRFGEAASIVLDLPNAVALTEQGRTAISAEWTDTLAELANGSGVVLAVEDVQWCDKETLALLRYTSRRLQRIPVVLVLTYRSDELGLREPAARFVAEIGLVRNRVENVHLEPLTWSETRQMVRDLLGLSELPPTRFVDELQTRTEGHPLFIEEVVRTIDIAVVPGSPVVWPRADAMPRGVSEALAVRLKSLQRRSRRVLAVAAVIGRRFDERTLVAVSGLRSAVVRAALREAVEKRIIVDDSADEPFSFRHALVHEAAGHLVLSTERQELHLRAAQVLEAKRSRGEVSDAVLAGHYLEGGDLVNAERHAVAAADFAWQVGGAIEASYWFDIAVGISDQRSRCNIELLEKAAAACAVARDVDAMTRHFTRLIAWYREGGHRFAEGDAICRYAYAARDDADPRDTAARFEEAIDILEPFGASAALARAYASRGQFEAGALLRGGIETFRRARHARELASACGARDAQAIALRTMGSLLANGGSLERGCPLLLESIDIARECGAQLDVQWGLVNLANVYMKAGDWEAAENVARRGIRYADENHLATFLGHIGARLVEILRLNGRWDESRSVAEDVLLRADDVGGGLAWAQLAACTLAADERRWTDVDDLSSQILLPWRSPKTFALRGLALFAAARYAHARGEFDDALQVTEQALGLWRKTNDLYYGPPLAVFAIEQYCRRGDIEAAWRLHRSLTNLAPRIAPLEAATFEAVAIIADAEGRHVDAVEAWRRCIERWESLRRPFNTGLAEMRLAVALLRGGRRDDRPEARAALTTARKRFEAIGAPHVADVDDVLRRSRLIASPSRRRRMALSEREQQIAALVGSGMSNRQIADELFLSVRTVENHVARIFAKLAITSRTQLASYAVQHGLGADAPMSKRTSGAHRSPL